MAFVEIQKRAAGRVPVRRDGVTMKLYMRRMPPGRGKKGEDQRGAPFLAIAIGAELVAKIRLTAEGGARLLWGDGPDIGKIKIERDGKVNVRIVTAGDALLNCAAFPEAYNGKTFDAVACFVQAMPEAGCLIVDLPKGIFAAPAARAKAA